MIYINPYLSVPINTIIGGVAGTISTKAALATKLAISESIIKRFEIVGSDVHAHITSAYNIPTTCFQNDTTITKYLDYSNHVKILNTFCFQNSTLNEVHLLGVTSASVNALTNTQLTTLTLNVIDAPSSICPTNANLKTLFLTQLETITNKQGYFAGLTSLELLDMRKLKVYGTSSTGASANNSGFANLKLGCEIRVHIALKTINSGATDPALNWVKNNRAAIVKFYDDDGNYVSTL